jgi:hypothetical protein
VATIGVVQQGATATLVTVGARGELVDRRDIDLVDPGMSTHPHHHEGSWAMGRYLSTPGARRMSIAEAVALIEHVRATAVRRATDALAALAASVPEIRAIALRACPLLPDGIEARIADARAQTQADGVMYREVLAAAATARGWRVRWYEEARMRDVDAAVAAIGRTAGPPWRAAHKLAAAAALTVDEA